MKLVLIVIVLSVISKGFADGTKKLEDKTVNVKTKNGIIKIKIPNSSDEENLEVKTQQTDTLKTKAFVLNSNNKKQELSDFQKPSLQSSTPTNEKLFASLLSTKSNSLLAHLPLEERIARLSAILNTRFEKNQELNKLKPKKIKKEKENKEKPTYTQLRNRLRFRSRLRPHLPHHRKPYC